MRISDWSSDMCSSDLTGDVMAEIGPDQLTYVDRRNNVLNLSQGEFVTVSKLEAAYGGHPSIRQLFVYEIGRASFRERVCQDVSLLLVGVILKQNYSSISLHDTS